MIIFLLPLIFRYVLFSLFCYKLSRLFVAYITPMVARYVSEHKQRQMSLFEQNRQATSTKCRLDDQIFEQRRLIVTLERNVAQWHRNLEQQHEQQRMQQEQLAACSSKRQAIRIAHAAVIPHNTTTCSLAVQQAKETLTDAYQTASGAQRFNAMLDALIHTKKSS